MITAEMLYKMIQKITFPPPIDDMEMSWRIHIEFEPGPNFRSGWRESVYDFESRNRVIRMDYREENELHGLVMNACQSYANELNAVVDYVKWLESI